MQNHLEEKVYEAHEEVHGDEIFERASILKENYTLNSNSNDHRLVYGIGAGWMGGFGEGESKIRNLKKVLSSFGNSILISSWETSRPLAKMLWETVGTERLYIDSGGFTLWKKQVKMSMDGIDALELPEFRKECEKAKRKFLNVLSVCRPRQVFELDNEYFRHDEDLMSDKNYLRKEVFDILGFYPTPVFKIHQGFEYWKRLVDSDRYEMLAIGGLANLRAWHTKIEELKTLVTYARQHGKKVHLLGCQNVEAFKEIQPDTVDYSIFQFAININRAKKEHPHLTEYKDLKRHMSLYALAAANARSFMYDCYSIEDSEYPDNPDELENSEPGNSNDSDESRTLGNSQTSRAQEPQETLN